MPLPTTIVPFILCFKSIFPTVPELTITAVVVVLLFVFNIKFFDPNVVIVGLFDPFPSKIVPVPFGENAIFPLVPATNLIDPELVPELVLSNKF